MAVDTKPLAAEGLAPAPPDRVRRVFRGIGKSLIAAGVLVLLFTAYELWGTGFFTSRAQAGLRDEIAQHGFPTYERVHHRKIPGNALGFIRIPKIDIDMVFVEGVGVDPLKKGPGHYDKTPLPGQAGNVGIAGHRTTYLHPFWALNRLRRGDAVILETSRGEFLYRVKWSKVVLPTDIWVLKPTQHPALTLTTCNPRFSASRRLAVRLVQVSGVHPAGVTLAVPPTP